MKMMNFILKMRMRIGKRKSACNFIKSEINDQSKVARSRRELFTVVIVFVFRLIRKVIFFHAHCDYATNSTQSP